MSLTRKSVAVSDIGPTRYADAWDLQKRLWEERFQRHRTDMLLFTEHAHVYTIGKGGDDNHLLASDAELVSTGAEVYRIDRGGDITYHGPGQIVGYPIIDLTDYRQDLHWYLRSLEEVIIRTMNAFGIVSGREEGMTGVWVKGEKVAAIGVKVSRWVTMHGFALNVSTDLARFDRIIPCGIFHKGVTSMERILGHALPIEDVRSELTRSFASVFDVDTLTLAADALTTPVASSVPA